MEVSVPVQDSSNNQVLACQGKELFRMVPKCSSRNEGTGFIQQRRGLPQARERTTIGALPRSQLHCSATHPTPLVQTGSPGRERSRIQFSTVGRLKYLWVGMRWRIPTMLVPSERDSLDQLRAQSITPRHNRYDESQGLLRTIHKKS